MDNNIVDCFLTHSVLLLGRVAAPSTQ